MAEVPSSSDATPRQAAGLLCPACQVNLLLADRQGIEIDYCPQCRGVWLDRGELDKIIERNAAYEGIVPQAPVTEQMPGYAQPGPGYREYDSDRHGESRHGGGHGGQRGGEHGQRGGFLGGLFGH
ncbi:recombination protein RecR [Sphingomonas sp. TF3]|uniref:TFIIB-type zinc ribbon-containing protein n=1 Tax=Sphingomonas sp. TF3 TaxID=2495580 RepID=UPI000F87CE07|nr:zf-TFIIB domain-containing protein [Sphingomonas sp. TF3]RUN74729.1 recombination protein RecR [Sphingomonas sp. TF3]